VTGPKVTAGEKENFVELSDYLRIIRQRGWLIILLALLTAAAAFGYSKMQTEVFESQVNMLVTPARLDFRAGAGGERAAGRLPGVVEQLLPRAHRDR
jgi:LPS O-antigen subunit length determinant protein (WzzB/FepE family)